MTVPTATFQAFQKIGNREDLENFIYMISPVETPFMSNCAKTTASAVFTSGRPKRLPLPLRPTRRLKATTPPTPPSCLLCVWATTARSRSTPSVCRVRSSPSPAAGIKDEMAHQLVVFGKRMKRDMESQLTQNKASNAGGAGSARISGLARGVAGVQLDHPRLRRLAVELGLPVGHRPGPGGQLGAGDFDGSEREGDYPRLLDGRWSPDTIMVGPFNKTKARVLRAFLRLKPRPRPRASRHDRGAADAYVSDFGKLMIVPNRFQRDRTLFVLDFDYWAIAYLRKFQQKDLAKTGDSDRKQILSEYTLVSRQEAASGKVTDLTTS
jgi:hypothetical protein